MNNNVFYNWHRNFPLAYELGYALEMLPGKSQKASA
jgi:hypothetical protein